MRPALLLTLIALLLASGCLEQRIYTATAAENVADTSTADLDNDGITDYAAYEFMATGGSASGMAVQRTMTVATETRSSYTSLATNLTTVDVLVADQQLEEFSKSRTQAESDCSEEIGLSKVVCSDVPTCSRLCSSASLKCKKIAATYDEALAGAMIRYVQDMGNLGSLTLNARRMVVKLDAASIEEKDAYLARTREVVAKIAEANANPIYSHPELSLCTYSDYGIQYLLDATERIGAYETTPVNYHYTIVISVKPTEARADGIGSEVSGIALTDRLPKSIVGRSEYISSIQEIAAVENGSDVAISWNSPRASKDGYILAYSFSSAEPPARVLASLRAPALTVKRVNLIALAPIEKLYRVLLGFVKNFYISLALAIASTTIALMLAYAFLVFCAAVVSERSFTAAFRKAFGRTGVTWKTDAVLAAIALAAGAYVCTTVAQQPATAPMFVEAFDFLIKNGTGMVGLAFVLLGVLLAYLTVENLVKIMVLEAAYGMVIRQEKNVFLAEVGRLKAGITALEKLVDQCRAEGFEVDREYDVLASVTVEKADALGRTVTAQNKARLDEYSARVDGAIKSLADKRRLADENWPKWSESITKLLQEQERVYTSSLTAMPVAMRTWALGRYIKERAGEDIVLEHDAITRKKMTADRMIHDMMGRQLIKGAVVISHDKVQHAEFADPAGATVKGVLTLKLRAYMNSLAKNLGTKEPSSLLVVGNTLAAAFIRDRDSEFFVFVAKDKFSQAIEQLRAKAKMLE